MASKIFVNLAVNDLKKTIEFFTKLGYTFNPKFTDETATCMIISEDIYTMFITKERFKTFTKKEISDATKTAEALMGLSLDSKEAVNALVDKAIAAGATEGRGPQDLGFMYSRDFDDLDGHTWEYFWMDPAAAA